jgi:hypothetical protein
VNLAIAEVGRKYRVTGSIDLSGVGCTPGEVIVEVYSKGRRERIKCGTHGSGVVAVDGLVPTFDSILTVRCNVRVVSIGETDRGKILAAARQIKPAIEGDASGRQGLLDFVPWELGQVLWQFDAGPEQEPRVLVNRALDWKTFAKTSHFRIMVMPEIARGAARWLWSERDRVEDGESPAVDAWRGVFQGMGVDLGEYADDAGDEDWVVAAVKAFADQHRFLDAWSSEQEEE